MYIEGEKTVYSPLGDGVDEQSIILGLQQRCIDSNMKLTWTRPLEVGKHPPDCMWILIATTRRDVTPGEELTIDRNEAAGSHYGIVITTSFNNVPTGGAPLQMQRRRRGMFGRTPLNHTGPDPETVGQN